MCTGHGKYILDFLEISFLSWNLIIYGLLELFIVVGLYGPFKLMVNIQEMGMLCGTSKKVLLLQSFWTLCWCIIMPITFFGILLWELSMAFNDKTKKYAHFTNCRFCTTAQICACNRELSKHSFTIQLA